MKATGIVRRIDDLGRVVIPKEIRRTMRIREGDPLEIYTDREGEVIFKKYSPIGELAEFAAQYADAIIKNCEMPVVICDRDHCIAAAGVSRKEVLERRISAELEDVVEARRQYCLRRGEVKLIQPLEGIEHSAGVICPIISAGDVCGAVVLLLPDSTFVPGDTELKLAQVAAAFLGKQMDE